MTDRFEDAFWMGSILPNEDGELFERVKDHEAVAMLGKKRSEVLDRLGWTSKRYCWLL